MIDNLTKEVEGYNITRHKSMQICHAMSMLNYTDWWSCSCCRYNDGSGHNDDCICDFYNLMR